MAKELDREKGIQAIIELQKFVGITEPREKAEKSWDKFSVRDKQQTMYAYEGFIQPKKKGKKK